MPPSLVLRAQEAQLRKESRNVSSVPLCGMGALRSGPPGSLQSDPLASGVNEARVHDLVLRQLAHGGAGGEAGRVDGSGVVAIPTGLAAGPAARDFLESADVHAKPAAASGAESTRQAHHRQSGIVVPLIGAAS